VRTNAAKGRTFWVPCPVVSMTERPFALGMLSRTQQEYST